MPARHRNPGTESEYEDPTLDDLRGQQPEELRRIIAGIDVTLGELHVTDDGELRELSAAEQSRWDRLNRVRSHAEARIREHERIADHVARYPGSLVRTYSNFPGGLPGRAGLRGGGDRDDLEVRARQLIGVRFDDGGLPDYAAERAMGLLAEGPRAARGLAAEYVLAAADPDYESAFVKMCGDPQRGHMLWTEPERAAYQRANEVRTAMTTATTAGGDMIPLSLDPSLMLSSAGSINPLRQICRVVQTVTNTWQGVTTAGATAEWKTEGAQAADGSPGTVPKPITAYLADVDAIFSYEVGMDAVNFLGELRTVLEDAVVNLANLAYTTGSAAGQPKGYVPNSTAPSRTAGAFTAADVFLLQNSLPARFSANASWTAHRAVINTIAQFETTNGALKFPELRNDPPTLLGKPVYENSNMSSDMTTAASRFLA